MRKSNFQNPRRVGLRSSISSSTFHTKNRSRARLGKHNSSDPRLSIEKEMMTNFNQMTPRDKIVNGREDKIPDILNPSQSINILTDKK